MMTLGTLARLRRMRDSLSGALENIHEIQDAGGQIDLSKLKQIVKSYI